MLRTWASRFSSDPLRVCTVLIGVSATLLYLGTAAGTIATIDIQQSLDVAVEIVTKHRLWVDLPWMPVVTHLTIGGGIVPGRGGHFYGSHDPGMVLLFLPFVEAWHHGILSGREQVFLVSLVDACFGGLLVAVMFRLMHRLCGRMTIAAIGAGLVGVGSMVWPYASVPFDALPTATGLLVAAAALASLEDRLSLRRALLAGAALGFTLLCRSDMIFVVGIMVLWFAWQTRQAPRQAQLRAGGGFIGPILIGMAIVAWYNWARFGSIFNNGHALDVNIRRTTPLAQGITNLVISPGRGLVAFCPLIIVAFVGLPWLTRRLAPLTWVILASSVVTLVFYGGLRNWSGWSAWGPRFLVPVLPLALIPLVGFLDTFRTRHLAIKIGAIALCVLSVLVQILGVITPAIWDDFYDPGSSHSSTIAGWHGQSQLWRSLVIALHNLGHPITFYWPNIWWLTSANEMTRMHQRFADLMGPLLLIGAALSAVGVVLTLRKATPRQGAEEPAPAAVVA